MGLVTPSPSDYQPRKKAAAIQVIHEETVFDSKHDNHLLFGENLEKRLRDTDSLLSTDTKEPSSVVANKRYKSMCFVFYLVTYIYGTTATALALS